MRRPRTRRTWYLMLLYAANDCSSSGGRISDGPKTIPRLLGLIMFMVLCSATLRPRHQQAARRPARPQAGPATAPMQMLEENRQDGIVVLGKFPQCRAKDTDGRGGVLCGGNALRASCSVIAHTYRRERGVNAVRTGGCDEAVVQIVRRDRLRQQPEEHLQGAADVIDVFAVQIERRRIVCAAVDRACTISWRARRRGPLVDRAAGGPRP